MVIDNCSFLLIEYLFLFGFYIEFMFYLFKDLGICEYGWKDVVVSFLVVLFT